MNKNVRKADRNQQYTEYSFEENNDLAQNMSNQHNLIHNNKDDIYYSGFFGDLSMQIPSSLNNFDKRSMINNNSFYKTPLYFKDHDEYQQEELRMNKLDQRNRLDQGKVSNNVVKNFKHPTSYIPSRSMDISLKKEYSINQANSDFLYSLKGENEQSDIRETKSMSQKYVQKHDLRSRKARYKQLISFLSKKTEEQNIKLKEGNKIAYTVNNNKGFSRNTKELTSLQLNDDQQSFGEDDDTKRESIYKITSKQNIGILNSSQKTVYIQSFETLNNRKLGNFEKGIQIIQKLLKNQYNKSIRIKQKVLQFVNYLVTHTSQRRIDSLSQLEYQMIGDISSFYHQFNVPHAQQYQLNSSNKSFFHKSIVQKFYIQASNYCYKSIITLNNKFLSSINIPVLMPTNPFLVTWDTFQLISIYLFLYIYSIHLFFGQQSKDQIIGILFYIIFFIVIIDVFVKFNTAFYEKDTIIDQKSKIIEKNIFSTKFWLDILVLAVIMFKLDFQKIDSMAYNPDHSVKFYLLNSIVFILGSRNSEKKKRLDDIITLQESSKHLYKLFCQLVNVLVVAHIDTWIYAAKINEKKYYEKYIYSLYWSITTMTTVGYGDITITNSNEAAFICVVMIIFSCVFAYSISNIGFILQEIEKNSNQLKDKLSTIQRYMNRKNVNSSLKSRVRFYLNFLSSEQKNRDKSEEDKILNLLSNKLRNEIAEEVNTRIINKFTLFSANFSYKVMKEIVFLMEEILVSPNEIIFQENDVDDQSIYFIQSGVIEIYVASITDQAKSQLVLTQLTSDSIFGEISFFSGLARKASARSLNLSTIYKINRQKFINLIQEYEEDFERFKMIQELIICQQNYKCLYLSCYSCKALGHLASSCPKTHICIDKQFISLRENYNTFQKRNQIEFIRKSLKKGNPMLFVEKNVARCFLLKKKCKNFNAQTELLYGSMLTDEDILNQSDQSEQQDSSQLETMRNSEKIKLRQKNKTNSMVVSSNNQFNDQPQKIIKSSQQISSNTQNNNHSSSNQRQIHEYQENQYKSNSILTSKEEKEQMIVSNLSPLLRKKDEDTFNPNQNESFNNGKHSSPEFTTHQLDDQECLSPTKQFERDSIKRSSKYKNSLFQKSQNSGIEHPQNQHNNNSFYQQKSNSEIFDQYQQANRIYMENEQKRALFMKQKRNQIATSGSNLSPTDQQSFEQLLPMPSFKNLDNFYSYPNNFIASYQNINQNIQEGNYDFGANIRQLFNVYSLIDRNYNAQPSIDRFLQDKPPQFLKNNDQKDQAPKEPFTRNKQIHPTRIRQSFMTNSPLSPRKLEKQFMNDFNQLYLNHNLMRLLNSGSNHHHRRHYDDENNPHDISSTTHPKITMDRFEQMKLYKRFFPKNNFDRVLQMIKVFNKEKKKLKKINGRLHKTTHNALHSTKQNVSKIKTLNFDIYKPTFASYGISIKNKEKYPITHS